MNYSDLDVFVLTYNRANYLEIMLESLCNQTVEGFNIKILNNSSTDNTLEIIDKVKQKYPNRRIEVITNETNLGNFGNFERSQVLANNKYTAVFHDDDAIHPEYIKTAFNILECNSNIIMCSGNQLPLWNVTNNNFGMLDKNYYIYNKENSSYLQLLIGRPIFASNLYRTEYYKKIKYNTDKYNKFHDIVFMMELNKLGDIAVIKGDCIRYRLHSKMDSNMLETGPYPEHIINILKRIKELIKQNFLSKSLLLNFGIELYDFCCYEYLFSLKEYLSLLVLNDVISKTEKRIYSNFFIRKLCKKILKMKKKYYKKKILNKYPHRY